MIDTIMKAVTLKKLFYGLAWLHLAAFCSAAGPGDVDLSFDAGSGIDGFVHAIVVQPDGKVIIGGRFATVRGLIRTNIARLNPDGSGDSSFAAQLVMPFGNESVDQIILQPDGKMLVLGYLSFVNEPNQQALARLNPDGSLDAGFHPTVQGSSAALQPDGKIIVGSVFFGAQVPNRLARLNSDGSVDSSFNPNIPEGFNVSSIVVQPDGKVLVGGYVFGTNAFLRRLLANGQEDSSFTAPSIVFEGSYSTVSTIGLQPDGKIVIGGVFDKVDGEQRSAIARLNVDGSLDRSFSPTPDPVEKLVSAEFLEVRPDGKIFVVGVFKSALGYDETFARYNADGSFESIFRTGIGGRCFAFQADQKILLGHQGLVRIFPDGNRDNSFNAINAVGGNVFSLIVQPDGKILAAGVVGSIPAGFRAVVRLNGDGSMDNSFDSGSGIFAGSGRSAALQPDGKIIVGGDFTSTNGGTHLARVNTDGALDNSFRARVNAAVNSIALQTDDASLIGGGFTRVNSTNRLHIARLNGDGSLDTSFHAEADNKVDAILVQPDGKVLIGGSFSTVNGNARQGVARLNPDGSFDTSFNAELDASGAVASLALGTDGKVLIAGSFTNVHGAGRMNVARLNTDGSLDAAFAANTDVFLYGAVLAIALQRDDKILVGGHFNSINGIPRRNIARLNADGSVDSRFDPGTGADRPVSAIALDAHENVLIGGSFLIVNGVARWEVARLFGAEDPSLVAHGIIQDLASSVAKAGTRSQPLTVSLAAATASIERGNFTAAINQLRAFQKKTHAQVAPLNPSLAGQWVHAAQDAIDALSTASNR